jgi:c-di-GMP-binding flagellar brake protein YcgR
MMKITFTRAWRSYRKGQVVDISGGLATQLLAQRVAVEGTQGQLIETAAVEQDAETADATPRKRRRAIPKPDQSDRTSR